MSRVQEWAKLYEQGASLEDIADEYGVSRQAVSDSFNRYGVERRTAQETYRIKHALRPDEVDRIYAIYQEEKSFDAVAALMDLSPYKVRAAIADKVRVSELRASAYELRYRDEELRYCLETFVLETGEKSSYEYEKYRRDRFLGNRPWPSQQTIKRLGKGKWSAALKSCGIEPITTLGGRPPQFTQADCIKAIQNVAEIIGVVPSSQGYTNHKTPESPSLKTIRNHFGSWTDALKAAGY